MPQKETGDSWERRGGQKIVLNPCCPWANQTWLAALPILCQSLAVNEVRTRLNIQLKTTYVMLNLLSQIPRSRTPSMSQLPSSDHLHLDFRPLLAHDRNETCTVSLLGHQTRMEDVPTQRICTLLHNLPSPFTYPARETDWTQQTKWETDASELIWRLSQISLFPNFKKKNS